MKKRPAGGGTTNVEARVEESEASAKGGEAGTGESEAGTEEGNAGDEGDDADGEEEDADGGEDKVGDGEDKANDGESEAAALPKKDAASAVGCPIGSHIDVHWGKKKRYKGVVTDFDLDTRGHYVVYNDSRDEQYEDLQVTSFDFVEEEEVQTIMDEKTNEVCAPMECAFSH